MSRINTICIVDDDPIYIKGVKKLIEMGDYCDNFLIFSNGQEAWDYYSKALKENATLPNVTLIDINMPVLDGWELLELLEDSDKTNECVIYVVSSSIDPIDIDKAKSYSFVKDYVSKPLTLNKIKALFDYVIKNESSS